MYFLQTTVIQCIYEELFNQFQSHSLQVHKKTAAEIVQKVHSLIELL